MEEISEKNRSEMIFNICQNCVKFPVGRCMHMNLWMKMCVWEFLLINQATNLEITGNPCTTRIRAARIHATWFFNLYKKIYHNFFLHYVFYNFYIKKFNLHIFSPLISILN